MSSSVANAQHLQKMDLHLGESDVNFLQSILPCLASRQSLQELVVLCGASGVFSGCATHTCICTFLHRLFCSQVCSIDSVQYIHSHTHACTLEMYRVLFDWCMCGAIYSVSLGFFH